MSKELRVCKQCGATNKDSRVISSPKHGMLCNRCYLRANRKVKVYPLPPMGEIRYSEDGLPICHICGEAHNRLMYHVFQSHEMTAKEYKKKFSLETSHGIIPENKKVILRSHVKRNYDKVVKDNLIKKGVKTRFKIGSKGRTKDKVSLMTFRKLLQNVSNTPTHIKHRQRLNKERCCLNDKEV